MRIVLACPVLRLADLSYNLKAISHAIEEAARKEADLVLFGEASLSGFEALTFDYQEDLKHTLGLRGPEIASLQDVCRQNKIAAGFGFYENDGGGFYSTYLVVGADGQIIDRYHRISPGWKEAKACADYREGEDFRVFQLADKKLCTLVCGDLWEPSLLERIAALDPLVDAFLWPVHTDISLRAWEKANYDFQDPDNVSRIAYRHQSSILAKPVLFINNYVEEEGRAKGGLYYWEKGQEKAALPRGSSGSLLIEL
jgi:predicted amidohydrolase